jgi:hypothetical protein
MTPESRGGLLQLIEVLESALAAAWTAPQPHAAIIALSRGIASAIEVARVGAQPELDQDDQDEVPGWDASTLFLEDDPADGGPTDTWQRYDHGEFGLRLKPDGPELDNDVAGSRSFAGDGTLLREEVYHPERTDGTDAWTGDVVNLRFRGDTRMVRLLSKARGWSNLLGVPTWVFAPPAQPSGMELGR